MGVAKPIDIVKLGVSSLDYNALMWWLQLACHDTDFQLGSLGCTDFMSELVNAFINVDRKLKTVLIINHLEANNGCQSLYKVIKKISTSIWGIGSR